jgi:hypothetical protein
MPIEKMTFTPGYITLYDGGANPTRYPIADVLRALDIPVGLTHTQVTEITKLANLVVVLIRTLIERNILDNKFLENGEYDLDDIIHSIEDMAGDFSEPDISV